MTKLNGSAGAGPHIHPVFSTEKASPGRLIHLRPDELASSVPGHVLFSFPTTSDPRDGMIEVTSHSFAKSINAASWYLVATLGRPKAAFETVAYIGPNDIRYLIFMFAAIKVGYKILFTSPRNRLDGHLNVLSQGECSTVLVAKDSDISKILLKRPMRTVEAPSLEQLLDDSEAVSVYPYTKSFDEAQHDPCLVLHTTGSTGLPKAIVWKIGMLSTYESWRTVPPINNYRPTTELYQQATRAYTSMPLFHTSGINATITWALCLGVTLVYGASHVVPNAAYVDKMHQFANVDASMGAPSIYEDLCAQPEWLERMKALRYVVVSGAPLSKRAGDIISQYSRVIGNLGSTETANLPRLAPSVMDWEYFYWHPTHSGIQMRECEDSPGLFELVIVKDDRIKHFQGVFYTFPQLSEWSMNDLYDRHPDPSKPFLWRYRGRKDDVIVLSNGEKIMPALMETTLMSNPLVRGTMMVGQGQFELAALIDLAPDVSPPDDEHSRRVLIDGLLPAIEEANSHAPRHGQLDRHHIIFADPSKPLHYLGQGKIQRRITYELYKEDIEAFYRDMESHGVVSENPQLQSGLDWQNYEGTMTWLRQLLIELLHPDAKPLQLHLETEEDFFRAGLDSLQVMRVAREINRHMDAKIEPSAIYLHPTLSQLTNYLIRQSEPAKLIGDSNQKLNGGAEFEKIDDVEVMETLLNSFVSDLPRRRSSSGMTVLLTGSTGSLGSYLLDCLYRDPKVERIVCFNRTADAAARQAALASGRGHTAHWDPNRVSFLHGDLSARCLGLLPTVYHQMMETVTHVMHNQWPVNFHWRISSFAPYIRGVRRLVDFCLGSVNSAVLLFVSSVSAVGSWKASEHVPEDAVLELAAAASIGYGQAKLVSECLLREAVLVSGLRAVVCRVGVITGPVDQKDGVWNRHEYIPAVCVVPKAFLVQQLINSSAQLGLIPGTFPSRSNVDWLPVDKVARVLVDIASSYSTRGLPDTYRSSHHQTTTLPVYHVVHPDAVKWADIVSWVVEMMPDMKVIPFNEWIDIIDQRRHLLDQVERLPAIKLVDFYKGLQAGKEPRRLATRNAALVSKTLRELGPANKGWLANWLEQWRLIGSCGAS